MAKTKMRDMIIVLPGIMGSTLQKDGRDVWAISGQAAITILTSLGGALQDLRLQDDDPEKADLGDGITATGVIQGFQLAPGLIKIDGYGGFRKLFTENFDVITGDFNNSAQPANYFEFAYDWRRDNRASAHKLQRLIDQRLPLWREV